MTLTDDDKDREAASAEVEETVIVDLSLLAPDYPPAAVSAEIGRVAIAAARVDEALALLLHGLHAGRRADWGLEHLLTLDSGKLKSCALSRTEEFFEGQLLIESQTLIRAAYAALKHRHKVMHTVWTLTGPDAFTPVNTLLHALGSPDPDADLAELSGRDIDSDGWRTLHPRSGGPGLDSLTELRSVRRDLEQAQGHLMKLRDTLASALYFGRPAGARRVLDPTLLLSRQRATADEEC